MFEGFMHNSQRFLIALLFSLGALSLLVLNNPITHQVPEIGQAIPPYINGNFAGRPAAATVTTTVTSIVSNSQLISTRVSLALSNNPVKQSQKLTITISLLGHNQGQNASMPDQQISISSSWGSTVNCTTQSDGTCRLDINAPSAAGSYLITAKYSGNIFFAASSASINLKVQ